MNKTTEALKLAEEAANRVIEVLEYLKTIGIHSDSLAPAIRAEKKALAAIREARAEQDKQEPVAWCELTKGGEIGYFDGKPIIMPGKIGNECHPTPLYAAPVSAKREWVDLTEGEQEAIYLKCNTPSEYTNAVIAAFKEKNK